MTTDNQAWPTNLYAVTIFTEDLDQLKEFYSRAFGLPIIFEGDTSAVFKFGETMINLLQISQADELINPAKVAGPDAGSRFVFTVRVDDVDALCTDLASRGVELLNGPMDRPWGIRSASFMDPSGYIWEIAH